MADKADGLGSRMGVLERQTEHNSKSINRRMVVIDGIGCKYG